jgi:phage terminase small subunit
MSSTRPATVPVTVTFAQLTEKQTAFVREYVERCGRPGAAIDAAIAAGFARAGKGSRHSARTRAYELLHNPAVLQLLRDELTRRMNAGAALGVQVMIDLAQNARSEQVRLAAAKELVDRGHGPVISRSAVVSAKVDSVEELLARLDAQERPEVTTINGEATEATRRF